MKRSLLISSSLRIRKKRKAEESEAPAEDAMEQDEPDPLEKAPLPSSPQKKPRAEEPKPEAPQPKAAQTTSAPKAVTPKAEVKAAPSPAPAKSSTNDSTWETLAKEATTLEVETKSVEVSLFSPRPSDLPQTLSVNPVVPPLKDGTLLFYWIDMHEEASHPGSVFLFGKVWHDGKKSFASCSVELKGLERTLYVAPRDKAAKGFEDIFNKDDKVDMDKHVIPEVLRLLKKHGIPPKVRPTRYEEHFSFTSSQMKKVTRQYHFDAPGVAAGTSDFLKVLYGYEHDELRDEELSGASYAHIFGAKSPAIENLIVQKRIMGPCWLAFSNVQAHKHKVSLPSSLLLLLSSAHLDRL